MFRVRNRYSFNGDRLLMEIAGPRTTSYWTMDMEDIVTVKDYHWTLDREGFPVGGGRRLARVILALTPKEWVGFKDGNFHNCRKQNLWIKSHPNQKWEFPKGVSWDRKRERFRVRLGGEFIGRFKTEAEYFTAIKKYNEMKEIDKDANVRNAT